MSKYVGKTIEMPTGPLEVLEAVRDGEGKKRRTRYRVKFTETGTEKIVDASALRRRSVRDPASPVRSKMVGKVFESNQYGPFEVIDCVADEGPSGRRTAYRIRFERTGYERTAAYTAIQRGSVRDDSAGTNSKLVGKEFESNRYGRFKVNSYDHLQRGKEFEVEFIDTGYVTRATYRTINNGSIKDKSRPRYSKLLGNVYPTAKSGDIEIVEALGGAKFKVKFLESGNIKEAYLGPIKRGLVRDRERDAEEKT